MTPFVADPSHPDDRLGPAVLRLMTALRSRTAYRDDRPGLVGLAVLRRLATFDDEAVGAAAESGFLVVVGDKLRITPVGLSIFAGPEPDGGDLLGAVARSGSVAVNVEALARRLGHDDPEHTWKALGLIEAEGTLVRWPDHPDGPAVALTALGAGRLGLRIASDGQRWIGAGDVEGPERVRQAFEATETGFIPGYDDRADPEPDAVDRAMLVERLEALDRLRRIEREQAFGPEATARHRAEQRARGSALAEQVRAINRDPHLSAKGKRAAVARLRAERMGAAYERARADFREGDSTLLAYSSDEIPAVRHPVGLRPPWPLPPRQHGEPCPACHGRSLARLEACLWCDRSGVDHLIHFRPEPKAPKMAAGAQPDVPKVGPVAKSPKTIKTPRAMSASWERAFGQLEAMRGWRKGREN